MSAEATVGGVLIRWTTSMEIDTVGFRILRETVSGRAAGAKVLTVVAPLVPATGGQLDGVSYLYFDNAKEAAGAVSYFLEDVDVYGRVTRHGPIPIERGRRRGPSSRDTGSQHDR